MEKQKLLKAIDDNGYVWDSEKLELRKKEPELKNNPSCWPTDSDLYDLSIMQHLVDD